MKASTGWLSRKRRREAAYQRGYEDGLAAATASSDPIAYLRHGEQTCVQNVPFGAMWISGKDDPRSFPVYDRPQPGPSIAVRALKPFATDADIYDGEDIDDGEKSFNDNITVGDLRRARTALAALSEQAQDVADSAFQAIANERLRQIGKGYDAAHDDRHVAGEIISATWGASARLWDAQECSVSGDIAGYKKYLIQAAAQIVAEYGRVERAAAPAKQEQDQKPLDLNITKEWFEKRAALEGDHEIGAGRRKLTASIDPTPEELAELHRLAHRIPKGWRLVPEDATDEMISAALKVDWSNEDEAGAAHNVWHAMIAAATRQGRDK